MQQDKTASINFGKTANKVTVMGFTYRPMAEDSFQDSTSGFARPRMRVINLLTKNLQSFFENSAHATSRLIHQLWMKQETKTSDFFFLLSPKDSRGTISEVIHSMIKLKKSLPVQKDWCCVHNFQLDTRPRILCLPSGKGMELQSDMERLIQELRQRLRNTLLSEKFQEKINTLRINYDQQEQATLRPLFHTLRMNWRIKKSNTAELKSPDIGKCIRGPIPFSGSSSGSNNSGIIDQPITVDYRLVREEIRAIKKRCTDELEAFTKRKAESVISPLMTKLRKKYQRIPEVLVYLEDVEEDIFRNLHMFTLPDQTISLTGLRELSNLIAHDPYSPYRVSVLVNSKGSSRPVIHVHGTSYEDLFGNINSFFQKDFSHIQTDLSATNSGLLYKANGGFLLVEASWIIRQFHLWELLKSAVLEKEIKLMNLRSRGAIFASGNSIPASIPLNTTVIITGSTCEYAILSFVDPDFTYLVGNPCTKEIFESGRVSRDKISDTLHSVTENKYFHVSTRKAILSLCNHPSIHEESFEYHLKKLQSIIERSQDYAESRLVTAEHISKALKELYPEISHLAEDYSVIPKRRTKLSKFNSLNFQQETNIESIKLYSGKVNTNGKQT